MPIDIEAQFSAIAVFLDHKFNRRKSHISVSNRHNIYQTSDQRVVKINGHYIDAQIESSADTSLSIRCLEQTYSLISEWDLGNPLWVGNVNGTAKYFKISPILNGFEIEHKAYKASVHILSKREAELDRLMLEKVAPDTSNLLLCPMPGMLNSINVIAGDVVDIGQALCVVEAMKMENILVAEKAATVKLVNFKAGDNLKIDDVIVEFEIAD